MRVVRRYIIITIGIAIAFTLVMWLGLKWDPLISWLIAINIIAFTTYGFDKSIAAASNDLVMRVPERVLLTLAVVGGSLGAFLGMKVFHHKTIKEPFRRRFWIIVIVQVIVIAVYLLLIRPQLGL